MDIDIDDGYFVYIGSLYSLVHFFKIQMSLQYSILMYLYLNRERERDRLIDR